MALPDLDTGNISIIAYWNVLDNGPADFDPTEVQSALDTSDLYSNGVQGKYTINFPNRTSRQARVRVKDDGWFVVWFPQEPQDFQADFDGADIHGDYDLVRNMTYGSGGQSLTTTNLSLAIETIQSELSNSDAVTFNHSDVGHYNYRVPNATTVSLAHVGFNSGAGSGSGKANMIPNSEVDVRLAMCGGGTSSFGGGGAFQNSQVDVNVTSNSNSGGIRDVTDLIVLGEPNSAKVGVANYCQTTLIMWWS